MLNPRMDRLVLLIWFGLVGVVLLGTVLAVLVLSFVFA